MKVLTLVLNIILFVFTCFVLVTDGLSKEALYIVFTLWAILTPIFSVVVISRSDTSKNMRIGAIIFNIISIGFICWALVDQYPHPEEAGFIEYVVLMMLTPIISIVAFTRKRILTDSVQTHDA
jgi:hypothetical protein